MCTRDPARPGPLGRERGTEVRVWPLPGRQEAGLWVPCRPGFSDSGSFPRGCQETVGLWGPLGSERSQVEMVDARVHQAA